MAQAREIKRRIRSVENTRQITRTMEMVAASKLKRATARVEAARPFATHLDGLVSRLADPELAETHPILRQPEETERAAVLLLTADRGLCGAFNANLIREGRDALAGLREEGVETELHVVGKKGISYFRFRGEPMASTWTEISDPPSAEEAEALIGPLRERFVEGALDAVYVARSAFRSALSTPPRTEKLFPVATSEGAQRGIRNYIMSPDADEILARILPLHVRNQVYLALVENAAAEQAARRTAMKNATDNAGEMLEDLRRTYNRARQAQITQEIAEIVGGAAALE